jgi:pyruvate,orthophosphate dikinase
MPQQDKRVYMFAEGRIDQKELLGNKGANLCEMSRLGLPVPPGFVITTTTCLDFFEAKGKMPDSLKDEYLAALAKVEKQAGKKYGDKTNPLLLSVRSGAAASMPGMMDTVLSLGLNDEIAAALVEATGNKKWVFDCYRRLIQMYQNVVLGKSTEPYEEVIKNTKAAKGYKHDMELSGEDWEAVVAEFKVLSDGGLPSDPHEQLETAIAAVFNSWFTPRAVRYREYNNIEGLLGTACNVQTMV